MKYVCVSLIVFVCVKSVRVSLNPEVVAVWVSLCCPPPPYPAF